MSRISIDVTEEEHRLLKAKAALQGKSLKELLVGPALTPSTGDEDAGLADLVRELDHRIEENAKRGSVTRTVGDIFQQAYRESGQDTHR